MAAAKKIFSIIAACLSCGIFLSACENSDQEIDELFRQKSTTEEAREIEVIYTVGGKTKTIITAPVMYRINDSIPHFEFPESVEADFYNEAGTKETVLTAGYGDYKDTRSVIHLQDSVTVINIIRGDTLYTDELYWDRNRIGAEFYTEKDVKIRTRTERLDGTGLEASQDLKHKLLKRARGPVTVPETQVPY